MNLGDELRVSARSRLTICCLVYAWQNEHLGDELGVWAGAVKRKDHTLARLESAQREVNLTVNPQDGVLNRVCPPAQTQERV